MMKYPFSRFWVLGILGIWLLSGCATDPSIKKQGEATRGLGEAYMAQRNYPSALKEFMEAERLTPDDPYLHDDMGLAYMAKNRLDLAIEHFKKAIALKPGYAPAINNLGTAYMTLQNWDAAIKCFNSITRDLLYATPYFPVTNLGLIYYQLQQYDVAVRYFEKALRMQPNFPPAVCGLSQTYLAQGKTPEALALVESGIKSSPKSIELYSELGKIYTASRNYDKAVAAYTKVVELGQASSPLVESAQRSLDTLKAGSIPGSAASNP